MTRKGSKKRQQIQPIQYFTTKLPLQESWLQYCPREAVVLVVFPTQQAVSRNFVREALLLVVKVVLVVFPTQQAASKQHDTTLESLHLRIKKLYSYE